MNNIVLSCEALSKTYVDAGDDVRVLDTVDFAVLQGDMIGVIGASGAGKSTLLHCLGGLDTPSAGSVKLMNHTLDKLSEKRKSALRNEYLGFIYQFHHLLPEFNALENVCMPLYIRGEKPANAEAKAEKILERVGLSKRALHRVGELSGGERQRIAIARALVTEPACVLADEPTGNLDQNTAEEVFELMLNLNQELKTSFVVVTHNMALAQRLQKTFVLRDAKLHETHD